MTELSEGLARHSLSHLVMPVVSIDEYESKIDDRRVIVTGFFVRDYDPALDLSGFIEKSSVRPLDTEVSPAPTDDGYYMVFVEMSRNEEYPKRLLDMLDQVKNLTDTKKWAFKPYGGPEDEIHDVDLKNLREYVNLDPDKVEIDDTEGDEDGKREDKDLSEAIGAFMRKGLFESIEIRGEWLRISDASGKRTYRILGYRDGSAKMPVLGLGIGDSMLSESNILQRLVGPEYTVETGDGMLAIEDGDAHLILAVDR